MDWQEFEDKLREKALQHEAPIDTEVLWERMQHKRKRRVLLLWWWGGAIAGLGLLTLWCSSQNYIWQQRESSVGQMQQSVATSVQPISANASTQPKWWQMYAFEQIFSTERNDVSGKDRIAFSNILRNKNSENIVFKYTVKNNYVEKLSNEPQFQYPKATSKGIPVQPSPQDNAATILIVSIPETIQHPIEYSQRTVTAMLPQRLVGEIRYLSPKTSLPLAIIPKKRNGLYLGLTGAVMRWQTQRQLSDDDPMQRENERSLEAISSGFSLQTALRGPWSVRSGLHFTRHNSVYNWNKITLTTMPRPVQNQFDDGTVGQGIDSGGWVVQVRQVQHYNRISTLVIPLDIHRHFGGRALVWSGFAGVQIQAAQQGRGVISGSQERPNADLYTDIYRRNISLGLRAGVSCRVPLGQHLVLSIDPVGMLDLTSRTAAGRPQERFYQYGIGAGLWYKLH